MMISRILSPVCRNTLLLRNLNRPARMTSMLTLSSPRTDFEPTTTNHYVGSTMLLSKRFFARSVDFDSDSDLEDERLKPKRKSKKAKKKKRAKVEPEILPLKKKNDEVEVEVEEDDEVEVEVAEDDEVEEVEEDDEVEVEVAEDDEVEVEVAEDGADAVEEEDKVKEEKVLGNEGGVKKITKKEKILYNEFLVRELMERSGARSAKLVPVRLIINQRNEKPLIEIKTLDEAITIASERNVDLIGISLTNDPPTVTARNLNSFLSKKIKMNAKAGRQNKPDKQIRFNAGIAEGDFDRRMNNVIKFLEEGHACVISATARGGARGANGAEKETSMVTLLDKIIQKVGNAAHAPEGTEVEEGARVISIRLEPARKTKAKKQ